MTIRDALAEDATNGHMLNRRGQAADIDPMAMLEANGTYIRAYGAEELIEWIDAHPRLTFAQFEKQSHETEEQNQWQ